MTGMTGMTCTHCILAGRVNDTGPSKHMDIFVTSRQTEYGAVLPLVSLLEGKPSRAPQSDRADTRS